MYDSAPDSEAGTITIHELLERSAESALKLQREDGSFPPGRNYTYDEPETPVRTTSHWTVTLSEVYDITGEEKFREAADAAVDYLLSDEIRPHGYTYHCRDAPGKDHCNGLVGQAGPIKALAHAGPILDRPDAIETAKDVFMLHPFDEELGLWERVEIDGKPLSFDRTLNHQIIFAAASAQLASENEVIEQRVQRFLDTLQKNIHTHANGLIKHYVRPPLPLVLRSVVRTPRRYDMFINEIAFHYYSFSDDRKKKERGYQTVNLVVLSVLREKFPEHDFWESDELVDSLQFVRENEEELIDGVRTKHGNPLQGIGIAKIRYRFFEEPINELRYLINEDLDDETENEEKIFDIDEVDENTQAALITTLTDLPNVNLSEYNA